MSTPRSTPPVVGDRHASALPMLTLAVLAWRNLWRNRRRTLITASTIAFGFGLAVVSIGLGDGGHNNMIRNGIRMGEGHLTIQPKGYLEAPANNLYLANGQALLQHPALAGIAGRMAPRISLQVLASTAHNSLGVGLQGMDTQTDPLAGILRPLVRDGAWLRNGDPRGVMLGSRMAEKLKARVGSKLVIMAGGKDGEVETRLGRVRGIFHAGSEALDGYLVLSGLDFARSLLPEYNPAQHSAALTRIAIFLDNPEDVPRVLSAVNTAGLTAPAVIHSWQQMMPELVNFIVLDDFGNYVWIAIIAVVVVFGILNTMLMSVLERTHEFGLVRALGLRPGQLLALVLVETVLLAMIAIGGGWVLGGAGHLYLAQVGLDLSAMGDEALTTAGVMMDPVLRSELSWTRIAWMTGLVFLATLFSGLYPAFRAARASPMEALRM